MSDMEKQILKLTENLTDNEMAILVSKLKKKIFKGGIIELNPEKKESTVAKYFEWAIVGQTS